MYEDFVVERTCKTPEEKYSSITLHFYFDKREECVKCYTLAEVAAAIDDFSTEYCDFTESLFVALKGAKKFVPCNFSVECEVIKK